MAEAKRAGEELLRHLTGKKGGEAQDGESGQTREHQPNVQSFSLSVIWKNPRRRESFPWSMYGGHEWTDDGDMESIGILFGERGCVVRGYRFTKLEHEVTLGKRVSIREHTKAQVESMLSEEGDEPIIVSIETFPPFRLLLASVKGDDEDENRNARRA
ncbi:MAG: hypothetical protein WBQ43_05060 [Terriglobales bacterium]